MIAKPQEVFKLEKRMFATPQINRDLPVDSLNKANNVNSSPNSPSQEGKRTSYVIKANAPSSVSRAQSIYRDNSRSYSDKRLTAKSPISSKGSISSNTANLLEKEMKNKSLKDYYKNKR